MVQAGLLAGWDPQRFFWTVAGCVATPNDPNDPNAQFMYYILVATYMGMDQYLLIPFLVG